VVIDGVVIAASPGQGGQGGQGLIVNFFREKM